MTRGGRGSKKVSSLNRTILNRKLFIIGLVCILVILVAKVWAQDAVTITTYYPAPFGVYRNLETTQNTSLATNSGGVGIRGAPRAADALAVYGRVSTNFAGSGTHQMFTFDLAEDIPAAEDVEPGDVVTIDSTINEFVTKSTKPYDSSVAGIISESPAFHISMPDGKTALALAGRVRCKVSVENGSIKRGDLLTTSSTPGHAMKATDNEKTIGTILGKALEPFSSGPKGETTGKIIVLVTLQ